MDVQAPNRWRLESLVSEIASDFQGRLRHADFVTEALKRGYVHDEDDVPLSVAIHETVKKLVHEGVLVRNEDEEQRSRQYVRRGQYA